jgi:hypothetical protein
LADLACRSSTSFSTSGAYAITADFSGSLDEAFTASAAAALSVSVKAPLVTVTTAPSAGASTSTSTPTPTLLPTTPLIAARPSPVFALSILTRDAEPLLNRHVALAVSTYAGYR